MLPVSARKVIFYLLTLLSAFPAGAQYQKYHPSDLRDFNLGFTMGIGLYGYDFKRQVNQVDPITGITLKTAVPIRQPGIYLGLISNLRLEDHLDLRFQPSVSLEQRNFDFIYVGSTGDDSVTVKKIENANLNLPVALKLKSDYYGVMRVYFLAGMQYSINLASNKKVLNDPDLLKVTGTDLGIVAAFGIDLYGEKIKLTPEVRYVMGLGNVYIQENTRFPYAISALKTQALIFTLNFE